MHTIGDLIRRTKAPDTTVRRVVDRLFPDAQRVGLYRVLDDDQAEAVEAELSRRGYRAQTVGGAA